MTNLDYPRENEDLDAFWPRDRVELIRAKWRERFTGANTPKCEVLPEGDF